MYCSYSWGTRATSWTYYVSRMAVGLAGRGYFTVVGMLGQLQSSLSYCTVKPDHLSQVWAWKGLMEHPCTRGMRNLDPVHACRFERSGSIYVQWKQWCTDEAWRKPILLAPAEHMSALALCRPALPRHGMPMRRPALLGLDLFSKCGARPSLSESTRSYRVNSHGCVGLSITPCLGSTTRAQRWTVSWQT